MSPALAGGLLSTSTTREAPKCRLAPSRSGVSCEPHTAGQVQEKIPGSVYVMRNEEGQGALKLLRGYSTFFFTVQGEIVWAEPIPVEARGVKGKEASGTKFSPVLMRKGEWEELGCVKRTPRTRHRTEGPVGQGHRRRLRGRGAASGLEAAVVAPSR